MKIELTPEQSKQIIEDEVIEIKSEDGLSLYFELDGKRFNYCEMDLGADIDKGTKRNSKQVDEFCIDTMRGLLGEYYADKVKQELKDANN